jgi:hypothetical protein
MWKKQSMQRPGLVAPSRRDEDNGARCCTQNSCGHAPEGARGQVCPNLRAHDDHGGMSFSGFFDDRCCSRPRPLVDHASVDVLRRKLHALDEGSGRQSFVADMKNSNGRMKQLGKTARNVHR